MTPKVPDIKPTGKMHEPIPFGWCLDGNHPECPGSFHSTVRDEVVWCVCKSCDHKNNPKPQPAPTTKEKKPVPNKPLSTYNGRVVDLTRKDGRQFTGKAVVTAEKVTLYTGKQGRPPVVAVEDIKKMRLHKNAA